MLCLAGAASVLALAPFFAWPVLFVTMPVLVWSLDALCAQAGSGSHAEPAQQFSVR